MFAVIINILIFRTAFSGDVLSGNQPEGSVHLGVLQEWFGIHWWNSRAFAIPFIVVFIMLPLVLFRRVGQFFCKTHSLFQYSTSNFLCYHIVQIGLNVQNH